MLARGERAKLPETAAKGPSPTLPEPTKTLIPTVNIAPAKGWPGRASRRRPTVSRSTPSPTGLEHPRWLYVLPNGDVLVAETKRRRGRRMARASRAGSIKLMQKRAGAGVPSANRITLLRDADGDGVAETRTVFLTGLNSPFGMALVGNDLYVANTDAVMRFPYTDGATRITRAGREGGRPARRAASITTGPRTSSPAATARGSTRPSARTATSARTASTRRKNRAAILGDRSARPAQSRVFASGLRNPNGMAWEPQTGALWTVVNERDELGSDLVPDYLTSVQGRRLLRLAVQLLRASTSTRGCRREPGAGRQRDRARLRARQLTPPRSA